MNIYKNTEPWVTLTKEEKTQLLEAWVKVLEHETS